MADTVEIDQNVKPWGGGAKPFKLSYGKMMMWFFILSDALSFSGFLVAYGFMRFSYQNTWPVAEDVFTHFPFVNGEQPLLYVAFMTFVLIMSSVTMVLPYIMVITTIKKGLCFGCYLPLLVVESS